MYLVKHKIAVLGFSINVKLTLRAQKLKTTNE